MFNSYDMEKAGEALKIVRLKLKLSQKEVAKHTELSVDTISRIENGKVVPRYDTLISLSALYRRDLLKLFNQFSEKRTLIECYDDIDAAIVHHDLSQLEAHIEAFKIKLKFAKSDLDLVYVQELEQILLFYECIHHFYKNEPTQMIVELLTNALKKHFKDFDINHYKAYPYSFIELRILLLYALCIGKSSRQLSTDILVYIHDMLSLEQERHHIEMHLKVLYDISYSYYMLQDDAKSEHYAHIAITLGNKYNCSYSMAYLYFRRGIAKFYQKKKHLPDLYKSMAIFAFSNDQQIVTQFSNVLKDKHGIEIDPSFIDHLLDK